MRSVALCSALGFTLGFAAAYIYVTSDLSDHLAAMTDGAPMLSYWQLRFALPAGLLGALVGAASALVWRNVSTQRTKN